jgi:hypothetical protein
MKWSLLVLSTLLLICSSLHSQNTTPFWSLAGNSNASTASKLGTTTYIPLRFLTNNLERMRITSSGWLGIGTTTPTSLLTANIASGSPLRAQVAGVTRFVVNSNGGVSIGQPVTGPAQGLYVAGAMGIGTAAPSYKLHVVGGGLISDGLIVTKQQPTDGPFEEVAITAISNVRDRSTGATVGIGLSAEAGIAGIVARGTGTGATGPYGFGVRAFGSAIGSFGTSNGVGVYGTSTGGGGDDRLAIGVEGFAEFGTGGYFASTDGIGLEAHSENNYAGYFNGDVYTTGIYQTSDESLKENITLVTDAMQKINQLKPSLYEFKKDARLKVLALPKGSHYGLIAQEVEKVFPEAVKETTKKLHLPGTVRADKQGQLVMPSEKVDNEKITIKAVNYIELIPILVRGMQEMDSTYKAEITMLKEEIETLKLAIGASDPEKASTSKASMKQNVPNPVRVSSTIQYFIPDYTRTATILVTNSKGQQLKSYQVSGTGTITFDVGSLPSGIYNYTLVADGKTILSKQLIIAR